ncbi:FadR/GntR family transcriptional regulator [Pseudonocardia acaciae]|uniref:FadR/GntR family transcriptional regulator n=1 Tax=Pseudonocardia acaciae TaxID=551276 RepID=UPI000491F74D|nr:FCD domain-containing protein [Pseudonocardia acaciae]
MTSADATASVVDTAIEALKREIEGGRLRPGERLPPEAELAGRMGLSRLSLREAVRALTMAGVVEVRRGSGTFVTDLRPDTIMRRLGGFLELSQDGNMGELFECRRILESEASALAAVRITDAELDDLGARIELMATLTDPEELVREDLAFHEAIAAAARNPTLCQLCATVARRTERARIWRALVSHDVLSWTHQQHVSIYTALRQRDSLATYTAASRHVADVQGWLEDRLGAEPS